MSRSQVLYSYDDATLKTFADYRLLSDALEISRSSYDYVIVTLDSFTTGSPVLDGQARRSAPTTSLQSRTRHPEFLAQVAEPQVPVNAS
jgi:hypothetical protein